MKKPKFNYHRQTALPLDATSPVHHSLGPEMPRERGQLNPPGLSAEMPTKWNEQLKRVLDQYPEALPYVELQQEWQALYQRTQGSKTAEAVLEQGELTARLKMAAAYRLLPLKAKSALVT